MLAVPAMTDEDGDAFKTGDAIVISVSDMTSELSLYPNPVKDRLTIEGDYNSIDIYDISGNRR